MERKEGVGRCWIVALWFVEPHVPVKGLPHGAKAINVTTNESGTLPFGIHTLVKLTNDVTRKWGQMLLLAHPTYVQDQGLKSLPGL